MLSNYLKIAFRNLAKNRLFTFLNIAVRFVCLAGNPGSGKSRARGGGL